MLSALIRIGKITNQEREAFESMWDQIHRTRGKLSHKQNAWVEKVYFKQGLDKNVARPAKEKPSPKIGFAYDAEAKRTVSASNMRQFETICPTVEKTSSFYLRVKKFFENGGVRFELRAKVKPVMPTGEDLL
jgi:hypothetical protein